MREGNVRFCQVTRGEKTATGGQAEGQRVPEQTRRQDVGENVPMELTRKNEKALQISSDAPTRSIFDVSEFKLESAMQPDTAKEAIDQAIKELDPK